MHYLIQLVGDSKDPINSGDMRSWFYYYKWAPGADEEIFFPIGEDEFPDIKDGDVLWFSMDGDLIGKAHLTRVVQDDFNDCKELWYNGKDCMAVRVRIGVQCPAGELQQCMKDLFEGACLKEKGDGQEA
jgi:hypothetical protein